MTAVVLQIFLAVALLPFVWAVGSNGTIMQADSPFVAEDIAKSLRRFQTHQPLFTTRHRRISRPTVEPSLVHKWHRSKSDRDIEREYSQRGQKFIRIHSKLRVNLQIHTNGNISTTKDALNTECKYRYWSGK